MAFLFASSKKNMKGSTSAVDLSADIEGDLYDSVMEKEQAESRAEALRLVAENKANLEMTGAKKQYKKKARSPKIKRADSWGMDELEVHSAAEVAAEEVAAEKTSVEQVTIAVEEPAAKEAPVVVIAKKDNSCAKKEQGGLTASKSGLSAQWHKLRSGVQVRMVLGANRSKVAELEAEVKKEQRQRNREFDTNGRRVNGVMAAYISRSGERKNAGQAAPSMTENQWSKLRMLHNVTNFVKPASTKKTAKKTTKKAGVYTAKTTRVV